jgi:hypothetical protein
MIERGSRENIPLLLENGYEVDIFSDQLGEAIMSKFGEHELDEETKLPVTLEPKRGKPLTRFTQAALEGWGWRSLSLRWTPSFRS